MIVGSYISIKTIIFLSVESLSIKNYAIRFTFIHKIFLITYICFPQFKTSFRYEIGLDPTPLKEVINDHKYYFLNPYIIAT